MLRKTPCWNLKLIPFQKGRTDSIYIYKDPHLWGFSSRSIFHLSRYVQPQVLATTRSPLPLTPTITRSISPDENSLTPLHPGISTWNLKMMIWSLDDDFPFPLGDFDQVPNVHFPGFFWQSRGTKGIPSPSKEDSLRAT